MPPDDDQVEAVAAVVPVDRDGIPLRARLTREDVAGMLGLSLTALDRLICRGLWPAPNVRLNDKLVGWSRRVAVEAFAAFVLTPEAARAAQSRRRREWQERDAKREDRAEQAVVRPAGAFPAHAARTSLRRARG